MPIFCAPGGRGENRYLRNLTSAQLLEEALHTEAMAPTVDNPDAVLKWAGQIVNLAAERENLEQVAAEIGVNLYEEVPSGTLVGGFGLL